jgi:hypothetical protein
MKEHKASYSSPYSPSPRVCADSKHDCAQGKRRAPYGKLHDVACASPRGAEPRVLLFTVVSHFGWKVAAFKVRILELALARSRDAGYLLFAALGEPVCGSDLGVENLRAVNDKPEG